MKQKWTILWSLVLSALLLVALTSATLAWFTSSLNVGTDRVTTRTGTNALELQISNEGGDRFTPQHNGEIGEIPLKESEHPLIPVPRWICRPFFTVPTPTTTSAPPFSRCRTIPIIITTPFTFGPKRRA